MKITRVVLAEDHAMVRAGIRMLLDYTAGIEVVGEASNGIEAIHLVNRNAPDVLILDMEMPELNGIEVMRELRAAHSPVRILALSAYDDRQYIMAVLMNGAAGYLTKDEAPGALINAVHGVARGETGWLSKRVVEKVTAMYGPRSFRR